MNATLADLLCCLALWVVPLAAIGLTERLSRRRDLLAALRLGADARSDPSAEMWSDAMRQPLDAAQPR